MFSRLFIFIMHSKSWITDHRSWQQREPVFYVLVLSFQTSVFLGNACVKCSPTVLLFLLLFFLKSAFWLIVLYWKLLLLPWVVLRHPSFQENIQCVNVLYWILCLYTLGICLCCLMPLDFFCRDRPVLWKCELKIIDCGSGVLFPVSWLCPCTENVYNDENSFALPKL